MIFVALYFLVRAVVPPGIFPHSSSHAVAQNVVSAVHSFVMVPLAYLSCNYAMSDTLPQVTVLLSITYFAYDAATIVAFALKEDWVYVIHHAMALAMLHYTYVGIYPLVMGAHILMWAEASNAFIYAWSLLRDNRNVYPRAYLFTSLAMVATYVPLRSCMLTIECTRMLAFLWRTQSGVIALGGTMTPLVSLLAMSWWYSLKMVAIAAKHVPLRKYL